MLDHKQHEIASLYRVLYVDFILKRVTFGGDDTMQSQIQFLRITTLVMLASFIQMTICPIRSYAQIAGCQYNNNAPSLDNARHNFNSFNYKCAEAELNVLLMSKSLNLKEKSDAHILMAAVYYALYRNNPKKREVVMDQFKAAFRADRDWKGALDVISPEFSEMMKEARKQINSERIESNDLPEKQLIETTDTTAKISIGAFDDKTAKIAGNRWYRQWWAIGLGVGVVAGAVVLLGRGGGGGETTTTDTLPSFPPPPAGK